VIAQSKRMCADCFTPVKR